MASYRELKVSKPLQASLWNRSAAHRKVDDFMRRLLQQVDNAATSSEGTVYCQSFVNELSSFQGVSMTAGMEKLITNEGLSEIADLWSPFALYLRGKLGKDLPRRLAEKKGYSPVRERRIITDSFVKNLVDETMDFLDRVIEMMGLCGLTFLKQRHVDDWVFHVCCRRAESAWLADFKYASCVAFLRHFKSTLASGTRMPVNTSSLDDNTILRIFPKELRFWLSKARGTSGSRKMENNYLVNTLFQGLKKGLTPVTLGGLARTLRNHRKNLTNHTEIEFTESNLIIDDKIEALEDEIGGSEGDTSEARRVLSTLKVSKDRHLLDRVAELTRQIDRQLFSRCGSSGIRTGRIQRKSTTVSNYANFGDVGYLYDQYTSGRGRMPNNTFIGFAHRAWEPVAIYVDRLDDEELLGIYADEERILYWDDLWVDGCKALFLGWVEFYRAREGDISERHRSIEKACSATLEDLRYGNDNNQTLYNALIDRSFLGFRNMIDLMMNGTHVYSLSKKASNTGGWTHGFTTPSDLMSNDSDCVGAYDVFVRAIAEPLKYRLITCGGPGSSFRCQSLQKALHGAMRNKPVFRLIGESVTDEIIENFVRSMPASNYYVSGDYSAATDKLKGCVSRTILENLTSRMIEDPVSMTMAFRTMLSSTISWEKFQIPYDSIWIKDIADGMRGNYLNRGPCSKADVDAVFSDLNNRLLSGLDSGQQVNGQLMGNIVSFVILCIANYCAYHIAQERFVGHTLRVDLDRSDLLINGDDILFGVNSREEYEVWLETISEFGFEPSAGKNLIATDLIQVNSVSWVVKKKSYVGRQSAVLREADSRHDNFNFGTCSAFGWDEKQTCRGLITIEDPIVIVQYVQRVDYVNFGLVTNRRKNDCSKDHLNRPQDSKRIDADGIERLSSLGTISDEVMNSVPNYDIQRRVYKLLHAHQVSYLKTHGLARLARCLDGELDSETRDTVLRSVFKTQHNVGERMDMSCSLYRIKDTTIHPDDYQDSRRYANNHVDLLIRIAQQKIADQKEIAELTTPALIRPREFVFPR